MSCSKLHLAIFFTSLLCIRVISFRFSILYEFFFLYSNARLRQSIFLSLQDSFLNLVQIVRIVIRVQKFWCFIICGTYFLCWYNFLHCIVNGGVFFLLTFDFFPVYRAATAVLSRPNISVLSSEVSQDLTFF